MTTRQRNNIWLKIAVIVGAILAIVLIIFLVWRLNNNGNETAYYDSKPRDVLVPERKDDESQSEETSETGSTEEKEPIPQYDGGDPNAAPNLTGALTYAKIMKTPDGGEMLVLRVNIDQFLSDGECNLTIKNGDDSVYSKSASIIDSASTSTCTGFDVPVSELGNGNMEIVIDIISGEKTGVINGEIKI